MKSAIVLASILFASVITPTTVFAHYPHTSDQCSTTEQLGTREKCILEQRQSAKEVKFVDMFFSEGSRNAGGNTLNAIPKKMEVEPGDGTTILVAVMANSGAFELTGLKGWLSLPIGFQAAGRHSGEPAFDSYDLGIASGSVFVFEFPVVVTENTRVGMYNTTLHVEYFKARDIGLNYRDFDVEFLLPGKSVLDARAVTPALLPSTNNNAKIEIVNDGSAAASGAIVKLVDMGSQSQSQIVSVGSKIWDLGVIKPHGKVTIDPVLYVNPTLANTRQNLALEISYFDAYGQKQTINIPVNFVVAGATTESIDFMVSTDKPVIPTITRTPLTVSIYNNGIEPASSVEVTVSTPITATVALNQQVPEASRSPISIIGGDGYNRIDTIKPSEKTEVSVTLFASQEAVNTAFQLPVTISYLDPNGGLKQIKRFVSVYVQGTINLRVYDLGITYIANQPNLSGYLLNEGTNLAMFTTVELEDPENQNAIEPAAGPQYLGDLTANSPLPFNIPIRFAQGINDGAYPVKIKVSYKDDLRVPFEKEIEGKVSYTPPVVEKKETSGTYSNIGIVAGIIGGAGAAGYYFVRKRRMKIPALAKQDKGKMETNADDLDFLSDSK